jgi:hypothetical protein
MSGMRETRDGDARVMWGLQLSGRSGRFAMGVILIALGTLALLAQQGIIAHEFWRHGWPWIIIFIASVQVATARSAQRLADGVCFGLIGVWLLLVETHWRGLTYSNSWPLTLVAVGTAHVVKALAGSFLPEGSRVRVMRMRMPSDDRDPQKGGGDA